ncbi:MAG TPA: glycoside hydrolase family 76 protein [Acidimicrobiales bacterium]
MTPVVALAALMCSTGPVGATPTPVPVAAVDQQEAVATYQALQVNLYDPLPPLYKGVASSSCGLYSCLWPFTNAMAATEYLFGTPGGSPFVLDNATRLVGLLLYADPLELSPTGGLQPPAFESGVIPPLGPGGSTYYDDNGWVGLDLIHDYLLTPNVADLALAQAEFNFAVSGWDTSTTDGCPGGVFWEDVASSQRNATANAANAEVGIELSRLTGNGSDLAWATRMYNWVITCLGTPSGLYDDHVNPGGSVNTAMWSYNQGVMVGAGTLFYEATGNGSYLSQAERTASAAVAYFGTGSTLVNQGPAFNAIYFRDLFLLNQVVANPAYASQAQSYASYMWTQRQPGTGLIDPDLGVNGTAPMVEIYSLLAGSRPAP